MGCPPSSSPPPPPPMLSANHIALSSSNSVTALLLLRRPGCFCLGCLGFVFGFFSSLCLWGETRAPLFLFFLRIAPPGLGGGNACIYSQINFCAKRRHLQMGQCVYVHVDVGARLCALIGRPPRAFCFLRPSDGDQKVASCVIDL